MATLTKKQASAEQALAGTTAVLGGILTAGFLAWASGRTLVGWDPATMMLFASAVPATVVAQFALNTTRPPSLPVKSALRFTALALGLTVVLGAAVGTSAVSFMGLVIPGAAMLALAALAATGMAGFVYEHFELGTVEAEAKTRVARQTVHRPIVFETSNDTRALREFDAKLRQALAEAQIELDFEELEESVPAAAAVHAA